MMDTLESNDGCRMRRIGLSGLAFAFFMIAVAVCRNAANADWPMYMGDASRSGYSSETLPARISPQWIYKSPHAPQPAWSGRDTRMPFDQVYHTVASGDRVFFGSSADCKVYCLDARTGDEVWTFFTDAPVRFAPALWKDRLIVGSDDGRLYCLSQKDGSEQWGRNSIRLSPGSMILGNDRMMARSPVRGGPVIADGIVYWAEGIWTAEDIAISAAPAESGDFFWRNDTAGSMNMSQPHPTASANSGVSPQGYLVVAGDKLVVPNGRGVPAVFDRKGGRFLHFQLQANTHRGGAETMAVGDVVFNRGGAFDLLTGLLKEGVRPMMPTISASFPGGMATCRGEKVECFLWKDVMKPDRKGRQTPMRVLQESWSAPVAFGGSALVMADKTFIAAGKGANGFGVCAVDAESQKQLWAFPVEGDPLGLAVSNGRLLVSTTKGWIYCFGAGGSGEPKIVERKPKPDAYPPDPRFEAAAEEIIKLSGVTDGYCLDLFCGDGSLSYELAKRTNLKICGFADDPKEAAETRKRLDYAGLYGARVTIHEPDFILSSSGRAYASDVFFPDYFADLAVSGMSVLQGLKFDKWDKWDEDAESDVSSSRALNHCLRPFGGVACLGMPGMMKRVIRGPLEGAGTWTHQYRDPANTNCSEDTVLQGPLGVLWFTDWNFQMPSRHGRGPAPLFLDGRLYVEGMNALLCVNPYNGRKLWEYPLPNILQEYDQDHLMGTAGTGSNFCIADDGIYLRPGDDKCLKIDRVTGKLIATFEAPPQPDGKKGVWGYIAYKDGLLYGTLSNTEHIVEYRYLRAVMDTQYTESVLLFAMDAKTGEVKWTFKPERSIRNNTITIGARRVFLIDREMALFDRLDPKTAGKGGKTDAQDFPRGKLIALDAATGKPSWQNSDDIYGTMLALSEEHDVLLMCYQDTRFKLRSELGGRMAGLKASAGTRLWDVQAAYRSRPVLNGATIYSEPGAWNLLTGEKKDFAFSRSYGCGTVSGSRNMLLYRSATMGYTDLMGSYGNENYGPARPGCWINTIPAGGLAIMPDATDRCICSYLVKTSMALQRHGVRPPVITPSGGSYREPVVVAIKGDGPIYYSFSASENVWSQEREYKQPFKLKKSATVKAHTVAPQFFETSIPAQAVFTIDPSLLPMAGPDWSVFDTPGANPPASNWAEKEGVVTELSNICKGSPENPDPAAEREGTFRIYKAGQNLGEGELCLEIASSDDDTLGVAFGYESEKRFHLWAMDRQRGFHILARKDGNAYRVLAVNKDGYEQNRWYSLRIRIEGGKATVFIDGEEDLVATGVTASKGTFAFYAWGCAGAKFRNVKWIPKQP